jgi:hypothetical protein
MHRVKLSLALLIGFFAGGCQMPGSYAPTDQSAPSAADRASFDKGMMSFTGTLRAPGTSKVPGAPASEWLIEMPKDTTGKVNTTAVDISNVADRARELEGKQVRAAFRIPMQGDPGLEASTVKLVSLEPR